MVGVHRARIRPWRAALILAILLGGWVLRLYGLNWDQGHGVHPDERYITWVAASLRLPEELSDLFDPARSGLNPYRWPPDVEAREQPNGQNGETLQPRARSFSYGHLPLYLLALTSGGDSDVARLALVGRVLSALFDVLSIALTLALGRMLYGAFVGVLAAVLVALTIMHIQLAHFATFDTALTCFVLVTLLFATRFVRYGRRRDAVLAGFGVGLAIGSKFSGSLLLLPLVMAHGLRWDEGVGSQGVRAQPGERGGWRKRWRGVRGPIGTLFLSLLAALVVLGLTNPFAVLQPDEWLQNLRDQGAMLRGDESFPFTLQYRGTWPYLYSIGQQLRWGMGVPLGLAAFAGLAYVLVRAWRSPPRAEVWIALGWAVVYFGLVGSLYVKFLRYMLPLAPVLAIFGAELVRAGARRLGTRRERIAGSRGWSRGPGALPSALVILPTLLYALAFLNVYRGDHPWLGLSRWIYNHVPAGATIATERWDHQLPLTLVQDERVRWPGEFQQQALDPYAPDTEGKLRRMLEQLAGSDYVVVASNRLYGSTTRWPERYPLMRRYYEGLFDGRLGFQLVAVPDVDRHPQLGPVALVNDPFGVTGLPSPLPPERAGPAPVTLNLGRADESFTVYDHPRPLLFRNMARLGAEEMAQRLAE
jgi:hypothetical protein